MLHEEQGQLTTCKEMSKHTRMYQLFSSALYCSNMLSTQEIDRKNHLTKPFMLLSKMAITSNYDVDQTLFDHSNATCTLKPC